VDGQLWWSALFSCLWDTGERIAAMMDLRWDGVDLEGLTVFLPAEVRKGGHTDRIYPIAEETAQLLHRLPREYRPFFWPYDNGTLYNRLTKMLMKGGLPADRRSKFHRIRRSTASHYEAAGGNATELLGHTSRTVTRGYLDPRIVKTASAVDLLFRPGKSDGKTDS
jgi:integrase